MPADRILIQLTCLLALWAAACTAAAVLGFWLRRAWKPFWLVTGLSSMIVSLAVSIMLALWPWAVIDPAPYLRLLAGFLGLSLAAGAILITRPSHRWAGLGAAVSVQSLALLIIILRAWLQCGDSG